jgi:hypothetical protein
MVQPGKKDIFDFDMTKNFEAVVKNKFWQRKATYDKHYFFGEDSLKIIRSVKIRLYAYSNAPFSVDRVAESIFRRDYPGVPKNLDYIIDRGNLRSAKSIVAVEIEFEYAKKMPRNLLRKEELQAVRYSTIDMDFGLAIKEMISVSNEILSLLLTSIHLTFPTRYPGFDFFPDPSSGLFVISSPTQNYYNDSHSNIATHPILLEEERFDRLRSGLEAITAIWHKDLWPVHRLLKALRTTFLSADNLLDLLFALEGLFPDNTDAPLIRMIAGVVIGDDRQKAVRVNSILKTAFKIRNEVVHGSKDFSLLESYPVGKENISVGDLFFEVKYYVIRMIIFAIYKLSPQSQQNTLSIVPEDLFQLYYDKKNKGKK